MNVWIVNPYGTLPGEGWREYRSVLLAQALEQAGHRVTWWISNFDHRSKRYRSAGDDQRQVSDRFDVRIVASTPYEKHISIARIKYEATFARRFSMIGRRYPEPDVLILAEPALFTSKAVLDYLAGRRTRLVVDVIDLWPELFTIAVPRSVRSLMRALVVPLYRRRRRLLRKAHGIVAVARDYLSIVPEGYTGPTAVVYWGTSMAAVGDAGQAERFAHPGSFRAIYAGTLGDNYDILTVLRAAEILQARGSATRITIAGAGPRENAIRTFIRERELRNVEFIGRVDADRLSALYAESSAALSTYVSDSTVSMPIKAYDYLAAGLPLINSLSRDLGRFVSEYGVGVQYRAEDPESLADAITRLEKDPELTAACSRNAAALAKQFEVRKQYGTFVSLLETVVSAAPG